MPVDDSAIGACTTCCARIPDVNHNRVYRLYIEANLTVRKRK